MPDKNNIDDVTKQDNILIDKFHGYDIFYDKVKERFVADKPDLKIHFESPRLWEIKGLISESNIIEVNKEYMIVSGIFRRDISKILLMTRNPIRNTITYKVLSNTEGYLDGSIKEDQDMSKLYEINDNNETVYANIATFQKEIDRLEKKKNDIISRLK